MGFRVCFLFSVVAICLVNVSGFPNPLPRDSSVVKQESFEQNQEVFAKAKVEEQATSATTEKDVNIPGRVWCEHEGSEPVETSTCQQHCIPKGYSYGLCISNKCSCI